VLFSHSITIHLIKAIVRWLLALLGIQSNKYNQFWKLFFPYMLYRLEEYNIGYKFHALFFFPFASCFDVLFVTRFHHLKNWVFIANEYFLLLQLLHNLWKILLTQISPSVPFLFDYSNIQNFQHDWALNMSTLTLQTFISNDNVSNVRSCILRSTICLNISFCTYLNPKYMWKMWEGMVDLWTNHMHGWNQVLISF